MKTNIALFFLCTSFLTSCKKGDSLGNFTAPVDSIYYFDFVPDSIVDFAFNGTGDPDSYYYEFYLSLDTIPDVELVLSTSEGQNHQVAELCPRDIYDKDSVLFYDPAYQTCNTGAYCGPNFNDTLVYVPFYVNPYEWSKWTTCGLLYVNTPNGGGYLPFGEYYVGYVIFRNDGYHVGWLKFEYMESKRIKYKEYAFNTYPNSQIRVGQKR